MLLGFTGRGNVRVHSSNYSVACEGQAQLARMNCGCSDVTQTGEQQCTGEKHQLLLGCARLVQEYEKPC